MKLRPLILLLPLLPAAGCIHVKMDPIEVHATVDVNVKVDQALNDAFGDLDRRAAAMSANTP